MRIGITGRNIPRPTRARGMRLAMALAAAACAAKALDNTIQNDFWDTTGYVNHSPNAAASVGDVADTIISNVKESNILETFRSTPPKGTVLVLR